MKHLRYVAEPQDDVVAVLAFAVGGTVRADILGPSFLILEAMTQLACGDDRCWSLKDGVVAGTFVSQRCGKELVLTGRQCLWESMLSPSPVIANAPVERIAN